jgi:hypothetical protein
VPFTSHQFLTCVPRLSFLNSVIFTLLSYLSLNISAKVEHDPGVAYISGRPDDNRGWLFILSQCFQNCPDKISLVVRAFASADDLGDEAKRDIEMVLVVGRSAKGKSRPFLRIHPA